MDMILPLFRGFPLIEQFSWKTISRFIIGFPLNSEQVNHIPVNVFNVEEILKWGDACDTMRDSSWETFYVGPSSQRT